MQIAYKQGYIVRMVTKLMSGVVPTSLCPPSSVVYFTSYDDDL